MPPPPDPVLRLRAALKQMLRCYGVMCVSVQEAPPEGGKAARG